MFQNLKSLLVAKQNAALKIAAGSALVAGAGSALAAGPDLTTLTAAVDFGTSSAAILTVAGALIVVYITIKASMFVIRMVRGG